MFYPSFILFGIAAGWLTGRILKGKQYAPFMDIVMGVAGSLAVGLLITSFSLRISVVYTTMLAIVGGTVLTILNRRFSERWQKA